MATPTIYTYSVSTDTANSKVNLDTLSVAITKSSIAHGLDYMSVSGDDLSIVMKDVLSSEEAATLNDVVFAHDGSVLNEPTTVKIQAESTPETGLNYQSTTVVVHSTEPGITYEDISWPFTISLIGGSYEVYGGEEDEDEFEAIAAPNTVIGILTQDAQQEDTVLHVSPTVFGALEVGFFLDLLDQGGQVDLGRVISINKSAGTVTVETPAPRPVSASDPAYVRMSIKYCYHQVLSASGRMDLGRTINGASHVPAGTKFRFVFNNKNGNTAAKKVLVILEYYY